MVAWSLNLSSWFLRDTEMYGRYGKEGPSRAWVFCRPGIEDDLS
jgi:hypothetical protein